MPILVPNPTSRNTDAALSHAASSRGPAATRSSSTSARPAPTAADCAAASRNVPSSASAMPTDDSMRYFHTASSERRSCRWKISGATARVVPSSPIHNRAKWWLTATSDAAARKASRQLTNARPPRGLSWRRYPTA